MLVHFRKAHDGQQVANLAQVRGDAVENDGSGPAPAGDNLPAVMGSGGFRLRGIFRGPSSFLLRLQGRVIDAEIVLGGLVSLLGST